MRAQRAIILRFFVALLMMAGVYCAGVSAQSTNSNANAAQGIQISPTLVELNAAKGKTYDIKLSVTNITGSDLLYNTAVDDFAAAGETGSPRIISDSKLPSTASIKTWVNEIPSFTLASQKAKVVNAQITIPSDAEPGGHYGVIRFYGNAPQLDKTGVGLSASAGVLVLIRVEGAITEKAELASFYTANNGKQTSFFENSPITFVTRVKNEGNIHIKPVGNIEVRDMFGGLVKNIPVNADKSNVLPKSIRRFDSTLKKDWMFGLYTVNLTMGYGTTGQAITNTISFWVIPYKIVLVALLLLVALIYILNRMIKVYNRRIIEKAKNENKNTKSKQGKTKA
jgi:hypothetical protein